VLAFDIFMLAAEAQRVINLRLAAIAGGGPAAELETRLMVTEKMVAALQAGGMLAQGASTRSVISFYRSRVQENVRRLTQKPPPLRHAVQKLLDSLKAFRVMTSRYGINKV
jgi:succinylarginine dihydrolase